MKFLSLYIAAGEIIISLTPILIAFLAAAKPRNPDGTFRKQVRWTFYGAIFLGVVAAIIAGVRGGHDYASDNEITTGLTTLEARAKKANADAAVTISELNEAKKSIQLNIDEEKRQADQTRAVSKVVQSSLANERRALQLEAGISQSQQEFVKKQQALLQNQKSTLLSQSHLLARQTLQIAEGEKALSQLNRTLNPIQSVAVSYVVQLPADRPEFANFREKFATVVAKYLPQLRPGIEPPPGCPIALTGEEVQISKKPRLYSSTLGISVEPGTDLYNTLPAGAADYVAAVLAWKKLASKTALSGYGRTVDLIIAPSSPRQPKLEYSFGERAFYLVYPSVIVEVLKPTNRISALPDLFGVRMEIEREPYNPNILAFSRKPLTDIQKACKVTDVILVVNGVQRIFNLNKLKIVYDKDKGYVSYFTFKDTPDQVTVHMHGFNP